MSSKFNQDLVTTLLDLSDGLASNDDYVDKMESLCERTRALMDSDRCSVFLLAGGGCWGSFNSGNPPEIAQTFKRHKVPLTDPMVQEAFEFKRPVTVNDTRNDSRMHTGTAESANIQAIILAPMLDDDTPIGFITAEYNQRKGAFSELDATLLTGVARLATTIVKSEAMQSERALLGGRVAELQRFEPLGRLAGGLAHDFNNVLTVVLGYCDLIQPDTPVDLIQQYVEAIRSTTLKAGNLSRQLLTFAKGGSSAPGALDLKAALLDLSPLLEDLLPDSITLKIDLLLGSAWVFGDGAEMTQLVMNLVLNARDAIVGAGTISIQLRLEQGQVKLVISDSGTGIDKSLSDHIFDPFFSTKDERGIGLGLANVKSIVSRGQGKISVQSTESGSAFTITLPEHEPGIRISSSATSHKPTRRFNTPLTLLLVDDQVNLLEVQSNWLKREGYVVFSTPDPLVAKAWIEDFGQEFDLLITDMLMPGLSGAELIDFAVKANIPNALLISGFQGSENVDLSRTDINIAFLQKPFRPSQLETAISSILEIRR